MTLSVLNGVLDRLQLVHLFLLNYLLQTSSSFIFFLSQGHHQLLGFWTQNIEVVFSCSLSLGFNIKSVLGGTSVMRVIPAPLFFLTVPAGSLQSQDLAFRDLNSSHTALLLSHYAQCLQHSGCSINICYGKRESQSVSQQGWMEVISQLWVLPMLPSLLGGHFFLILADQYYICPSRLAHSPWWSFPWSPLC